MSRQMQRNRYRILSSEQVDAVTKVRQMEHDLSLLLDELQHVEGVDVSSLLVARTGLQTSMMWLVKAVAGQKGPL